MPDGPARPIHRAAGGHITDGVQAEPLERLLGLRPTPQFQTAVSKEGPRGPRWHFALAVRLGDIRGDLATTSRCDARRGRQFHFIADLRMRLAIAAALLKRRSEPLTSSASSSESGR